MRGSSTGPGTPEPRRRSAFAAAARVPTSTKGTRPNPHNKIIIHVRHHTRRDLSVTHESSCLFPCLFIRFHFEFGIPDTLQRPQHVRHADILEYPVVPAGRTRRITVETSQIRIKPVLPAGTRFDRQIGRRRAEPRFCVFRAHRDRHRVADFVGRKKQILLNLCSLMPMSVSRL